MVNILRTEKRLEMFNEMVDLNVFKGKFKKKSNFSLNSGNFYVTLQLEMRPRGRCSCILYKV